MKNLFFFILTSAIAIVSCEESPSKSVFPSENEITEADVKSILADWEVAYQQKDSSIMSRILHDDYVYAGDPSGNITTKSQYVKSIPKGDYKDFSFEFDSLDINLYDDIAVVRGRETIRIISSEDDTVFFKLRFTDVYKKQNGIAKALSTHSSGIEE